MKDKKYITHNLMGKKETTILHIVNYGELIGDNKLKYTTNSGVQIKPISEIKETMINVIGFDEIDFPGSLWKWEKQRNQYNKPYRLDETIIDGELVKDNFWSCFDVMVKVTETEILYKPILL